MSESFPACFERLESLSTEELDRSVADLVGSENRTVAQVIAHLAEIARRKGYASHYTSFARFDGTFEERRRFDGLISCFLPGEFSAGCSYRHSFLSL